MIVKPATISFASAKGPSVTPEAVRTLPEGFSLLPISRILALNFSFHPLKAANISWHLRRRRFMLARCAAVHAEVFLRRHRVLLGLFAPIRGASSKRRAERGKSDTCKKVFFPCPNLTEQ